MKPNVITPAHEPNESAPTKLLRRPEVLARVPWSYTTLWRQVKSGNFPAPIKMSAHAVAWRERDVEAWIAAKAAEGR